MARIPKSVDTSSSDSRTGTACDSTKVAPQEGASAPTASRCTDIPSLHHDDPISAETGRIESLQQAHEQCVTLLEAGIAKAKRGGGPWASSTTSLRGGSSASVASSECSDSQVLFSLPPVTQRRTGSSSSWEVQSSSSVSSLGWRSRSDPSEDHQAGGKRRMWVAMLGGCNEAGLAGRAVAQGNPAPTQGARSFDPVFSMTPPKPKDCGRCAGSMYGKGRVQCHACSGIGHYNRGAGRDEDRCGICYGKSWEVCPSCGGSGHGY